MEEKINLDELYPGLENVYEYLYSEYGAKFDKNINILKYMYIFIIVISVITIFLGINFFHIKGPETTSFIMYVLIIACSICIILPFMFNAKSIVKEEIEIENTILRYIKPDIIRQKDCEEKNSMKEEYKRSDPHNRMYNSYRYSDYYKFSLSDGRIVEDVYLEVEKITYKGMKRYCTPIFYGQFIKIKNKYNFKNRIDILKDEYNLAIEDDKNEEFEKTKIFLDSPSFEKYFKIYCKDENYAYQFLTSDVMELLTNYKNVLQYGFDITLVDDDIYIKLPMNMIGLYSNALNNPLKRSTVEYFVQRIKNSMDFIEEFVKIVDNKNM